MTKLKDRQRVLRESAANYYQGSTLLDNNEPINHTIVREDDSPFMKSFKEAVGESSPVPEHEGEAT